MNIVYEIDSSFMENSVKEFKAAAREKIKEMKANKEATENSILNAISTNGKQYADVTTLIEPVYCKVIIHPIATTVHSISYCASAHDATFKVGFCEMFFSLTDSNSSPIVKVYSLQSSTLNKCNH